MDEDAPHQMRWPRVVARVAGYALLAIGLYILSVGPMYWLLAYRSHALDVSLAIGYAPLFRLDEQISPMGPLRTYVAWWGNLPGGYFHRPAYYLD